MPLACDLTPDLAHFRYYERPPTVKMASLRNVNPGF